MNANEIYDAIKGLSMSQGFYGRLLVAIDEEPTIMDELVAQNFGDVVDMIMYIEG